MAQVPKQNAIHTTVRAIVDGTMRMEDLYGHFGSKKEALAYYAANAQPFSAKEDGHAFCQSCSNQPASVVLNYSARATTNHNLAENILRIAIATPLAFVSRTLVKLFFGNDMLNVEGVAFACTHKVCRSCNLKLETRKYAGELLQILSWGVMLVGAVCFACGVIGACFAYGLPGEFAGFLAFAAASAVAFSAALYAVRVLCPKIRAPQRVRQLASSPFRLI